MLQKTPQIQFAIDAVASAMQVAKQVQQDIDKTAITKSDNSPVTVADFSVQAVIGRHLKDAFPMDALVGEEDAAGLRGPESQVVLAEITEHVSHVFGDATPESVCDWIDVGNAEPGERFWVLDPVDGTKGFLRGGQYAIALALVENGRVRLGVLGCPNLNAAFEEDMASEGILVVAAQGQGTWCVPSGGSELKPLSVSACQEVTAARLLSSVESSHTNFDQLGDLQKALGTEAEPVRMDSQAKYALLAAGKGELFFRLLSSKKPDYREWIWDQAAGSIVVEEAGGRVTDLRGKPLDFGQGKKLLQNQGVLVSNELLHKQALDALEHLGRS